MHVTMVWTNGQILQNMDVFCKCTASMDGSLSERLSKSIALNVSPNSLQISTNSDTASDYKIDRTANKRVASNP